jgi:cell division protein FtsW (lipid II flippase)
MHLPNDLRLLLLIAAVPALLGSVLLMRAAGAGNGVIAQQIVFSVIGGCAMMLAKPSWQTSRQDTAVPWFALALTALLFMPLAVGEGDGPRRWLSVLPSGGFRLYAASIVLPVVLVLLASAFANPLRRDSNRTRWLYLVILGATVALLLQPDAAQLTAFACACVPLLLMRGRDRLVRLAIAVVVIICIVFACRIPDPLQPVSTVEGVFALATGFGIFAGVMAVVAAIFPSAALLLCARRQESHLLVCVAIYYLVLTGLAPLQVTPVPLLGFGAGPILGYFLMSYIAQHEFGCANMPNETTG